MKRALIIEDNINNMELMGFILESHGHVVYKSYNGRDGIATAIRERPDFILLDIQLPDIMGTEVLALLRKEPGLEHTPIIAVTSFAMAGDEQRLIAAGCTGYIEKPINPDIIFQQIQRITETET
ncbi:MAG TPA: response regulator [Kiritimatiellia bacterium]|nr:response regulator [Kiritimatiellia bacterium]